LPQGTFFSRKLKQIVKFLSSVAASAQNVANNTNIQQRLDIDSAKWYTVGRMNPNKSYLHQQWTWRWPWRQLAFRAP